MFIFIPVPQYPTTIKKSELEHNIKRAERYSRISLTLTTIFSLLFWTLAPIVMHRGAGEETPTHMYPIYLIYAVIGAGLIWYILSRDLRTQEAKDLLMSNNDSVTLTKDVTSSRVVKLFKPWIAYLVLGAILFFVSFM